MSDVELGAELEKGLFPLPFDDDDEDAVDVDDSEAGPEPSGFMSP